jgi:succinylarginine dihydrolase
MELAPRRYPARQTYEACAAIARRHGLDPDRVVFAQQTPEAIDLGVFHNDVISVGSGTVLFHHERAYVQTPEIIDVLRARVSGACDAELTTIRVGADEISIEECVRTYLFNSQLLSVPGREGLVLVAPQECRESEAAAGVIRRLVEGESPIGEVRYFDLRQSMRNGGGPACLRLRVVLTEAESGRVNGGVLLTEALAGRLEAWITRHYREELALADLADPALVRENRDALDELTGILGLGAVYEFQR